MSVANSQKFIIKASSRFRRVQSNSILDEMLFVIVPYIWSMFSVPHSVNEVVSYFNLYDFLYDFVQFRKKSEFVINIIYGDLKIKNNSDFKFMICQRYQIIKLKTKLI